MELRTCPERFVCDSIVLRQFCRLYLESAPDETTLIRWANQIGPQTVASLNDRAVELARSLKVTRGRKLRVDSTVVETKVHHPTDSRLLGDGVRVVSRLLRRAREALGEEGAHLGKEAFPARSESRGSTDARYSSTRSRGHHKPLRGAFGGWRGAPTPAREYRGSPRVLRTGAGASKRRPWTVLEGQRTERQEGGHTARGPASERSAYQEAKRVRKATMVQAGFRLQSGR